MTQIARIPITNVLMDGDYTGKLTVGPAGQVLNVILDTGSSALAVSGRKYVPTFAAGEAQTDTAQTDAYGDKSSWTGAVVTTVVSIGSGSQTVTAENCAVAVAYDETSNMFDGTGGILGLAYQYLDDAYTMPAPTWTTKYTARQVLKGDQTTVVPYLAKLAQDGIMAEKVSFYTRRSQVHEGHGLSSDPLNQGWMIVGGGEEATDLYTGPFQVVKVLSRAWYCTNLISITVGNAAPISVRSRPARGMPSNSVVDSGTNSLCLGPTILKAIYASLTPDQAKMIRPAIVDESPISMDDLDLQAWPNLTFVLQGLAGNVTLVVEPRDYWQVNAPKVDCASCSITLGQDGNAILGLPLMNPYFTIFDGAAEGGMGVIKFATATGR